MKITDLEIGVKEILEENKRMLEIPMKEIALEAVQFCKDNGIELHSPEYTSIMNYFHFWIGVKTSFFFTIEKIKHETSKPSDNLL